jgi:hypothetical protein
MEIEIFTLCDFAQDNNGKLTIVGTFDKVFTTQLPVRQNCCVVIKMRLGNSEAGRHNVKLKFINEAGKEFIAPASLDIDHRVNPVDDYNAIPVIMNFHPLQLEKAGRYAIELYYDDDFKSGFKLTVVHGMPGGVPQ